MTAQLFPKIYDSDRLDIFVDRDGDDQRVYAHDKATDVYHQYDLAGRQDHEVIVDILERFKKKWTIDHDTVLWYNSLSRGKATGG